MTEINTRASPHVVLVYNGNRAIIPSLKVNNNLKFHYVFLLTKLPPEGSTKNRHSSAIISNTENRAFLDFVADNNPVDGWQIKISGTKVMHLWTESDDWEMVLKLSERFENHRTGIITKEIL